MIKFNNTGKFFVLLPLLCILTLSCSKEDKEVSVAEINFPSYDQGHLIIVMNEVTVGVDPSILVSDIELTNLSKGTVNQFSPTLFTYLQVNGISTLSTPYTYGNTGDQLECCVNFTSAISVGIGMRFENIPADSVTISAVNSNSFCGGGTYQ